VRLCDSKLAKFGENLAPVVRKTVRGGLRRVGFSDCFCVLPISTKGMGERLLGFSGRLDGRYRRYGRYGEVGDGAVGFGRVV